MSKDKIYKTKSIKDLKIGDKFNKLTIIDKSKDTLLFTQKRYLICRCDCGNIKNVLPHPLQTNGVKSCGCLSHKPAENRLNLIGKNFGKLTVISLDEEQTKIQQACIWLCLCNKELGGCGLTKYIVGGSLTNGSTKSCGCGVDIARYGNKRNNKSYEEISGEYWSSIKLGAKSRDIDFNITIQEAWELVEKQNYKCNLSGIHLTFKRYSKMESGKVIFITGTASLDRIDSSKGYTKENCQWIHKDINWMKNDMKQNEFIEMCNNIADHSKPLVNNQEYFG